VSLSLSLSLFSLSLSLVTLDDNDAWLQLGIEALHQGNFEVVEMSYQKTKDFERLSFLYLITGNLDKLKKMMKIAEMRNDIMSVLHNSLYLGDVEERMKILESTGQYSMVYVLANVYGLNTVNGENGGEGSVGSRLNKVLSDNQKHLLDTFLQSNAKSSHLVLPPTPIYKNATNWPYLAVASSSAFASGAVGGGDSKGTGRAGGAAEGGSSKKYALMEEDDGEPGGGGQWDNDDDLEFEDADTGDHHGKGGKKGGKGAAEAGGAAGWHDDDLDISLDEEDTATGGKGAGVSASKDEFGDNSYLNVPSVGNPVTLSWCNDSSHCADHFAAGSVETAMQLLNRQIAASNLSLIKPNAVTVFLGSQAYLPGIFHTPSTKVHLFKVDKNHEKEGKDHKHGQQAAAAQHTLPILPYNVNYLLDLLKESYRAFTSAQMEQCQSLLSNIMAIIPLVSVANKSEKDDLKEILTIAREYMISIRIKSSLDKSEDIKRSLELAALFTHCNLQPAHLLLALKTAMAIAFKNKVTSSSVT
jgi:coatomer protein complex subunit alpha (xenin)